MIGFILLCGLGSWQVWRLETKLALIKQIEEQTKEAPVLLPKLEDNVQTNWLYRPVILEGEWLYDEQKYLFTGAMRMRGEVGYNIFMPFRLTDGRIVLVDRGWAPYNKKKMNAPTPLVPDDQSSNDIHIPQVIVGMILRKEKPALFTPDNDIASNMWFWVDIPAMLAGVSDAPKIEQFYVRQIQWPGYEMNQAGKWTIIGTTSVHYRNDHLQYAITWYSLAIILVIVYVAFRRSYRV